MEFNLSEYLKKRKDSIRRNLPFSVAYFVYTIGWGFVNPIFSIKVNQITGSFLLTGFFFSLWGGLRSFLNIFFGMVADRVNVKRMIQYALISYASLVSLGYFFVKTIPTLFLIRIIHVLSGSAIWTGYWVYLRSKGKRTVEKLSVPRTFLSAAKLIGPFIGGIIATYLFPEFTFLLLSASCLVSFLIVTFRLKELPAKKEDHLVDNFSNKLTKTLKKSKKLIKIGVPLAVITLTIRSFVRYFPLLLEKISFSSEVIGVLFSIRIIPSLMVSIPVGVWADRTSRKKPLLYGFTFLTAGYSAFVFSSNLLILATATFFVGIGTTLIYPVLNSIVSDKAEENDKGEISGLGESFKDCGGFMGLLLFGLISSLQNLRTGFLILTLISLIPIGLVLSGKLEI